VSGCGEVVVRPTFFAMRFNLLKTIVIARTSRAMTIFFWRKENTTLPARSRGARPHSCFDKLSMRD
jgi:hypothetical protein